MSNIVLLDLPTQYPITNLILHVLEQHNVDVDALINALPNKSFLDADDAWVALHELLGLLDQRVSDNPGTSARLTRARFYRYNLAELYLREAEDYRLFWVMELPDRLRVAINRTMHPYLEQSLRHEAMEMAKKGLILTERSESVNSKRIYRKAKDFKDYIEVSSEEIASFDESERQ